MQGPEEEIILPQKLGTSCHSALWDNWLATQTVNGGIFMTCCLPGSSYDLHFALAASINCEAFCSSSKHVDVQSQSVSTWIAVINF